MNQGIQDMNLAEVEIIPEPREAPEGVDPKVWQQWEDEEALKQDKFLWMLKRGIQGHNVGFDNGRTNVNKYLYGTHKARYYLIGGESGAGKCLGKGTKVIMYDGTLKAVEEVTTGDQLMGPDGTLRNVLSTCTGREQMYWVRQKRGIDYRVNESHILSLVYKPKDVYSSTVIQNQEHIEKNKRKRVYTFVETFESEVKNLSVKEYLAVTNKRLYHGWKSPVSFGNELVAIDPYFLGLWLGDGTSAKTEITNIEPEVLEYLQGIPDITTLQKDSVTVRLKAKKELEMINPSDGKVLDTFSSAAVPAKKYNTKEEYITRATKNGKVVVGAYWKWKTLNNSLLSGLRHYKLLSNKHIPQQYIRSSLCCRKTLLAGLIDSDGYYDPIRNMVEITQKNKLLAEQIVFLVRSIGFYVTIKEKTATMNRADGTIYRCQVYRIAFGHCTSVPCRVKRKQAIKPYTKTLCTDISVEKDIVDDYYGFVIDGDHLFLLEDFTVTHNTTIGDFMYVLRLWFSAKKMNRRVKIVYLSYEIGTTEKLYRWCSYFIFLKYGIRLPSAYLQGQIHGHIPSGKHVELALEAYSTIKGILDRREIIIIEDVKHPTAVFEGIITDHFDKEGTVSRAEVSEEDRKKHKKGYVTGYQENDPDLMTMLVIDHLALTGSEMGLDTKGTMDKMSRYMIVLRNMFHCSGAIFQQFSTDMMSAYRGNYGKKDQTAIKPTRLDFGDSKATFRDADVVLGCVKPQGEMDSFYGFNLANPLTKDGLGQYFVAEYIMKNRYGPSGRLLPLFVDYVTGWCCDLPLNPGDSEALKPFLEHAKQIEKICLDYSPTNP